MLHGLAYAEPCRSVGAEPAEGSRVKWRAREERGGRPKCARARAGRLIPCHRDVMRVYSSPAAEA